MITQTDPDLQATPRRELSAQRIDRPHSLQNGQVPPSPLATHATPPLTSTSGQQQPQTTIESLEGWHESLLNLHAEDLVQHLQSWALEIDAREAQLNARAALQDLQERQFRQWVLNRNAEIDELSRAALAHEKELRTALRSSVIMEMKKR